MNAMLAKAILNRVVAILGASLGPNFVAQGRKLVRAREQVVWLIEFQPSRTRTEDYLTFAINYGVIVRTLAREEELKKPEYTQCHWGGRVRAADGKERWFAVRTGDVPDGLANATKNVLDTDVLPLLDRFQHETDLISLWKTGRAPGLVEGQRLLFLGRLLHRAGRLEEFAAIVAELERKATNPFEQRALETLRSLRVENA